MMGDEKIMLKSKNERSRVGSNKRGLACPLVIFFVYATPEPRSHTNFFCTLLGDKEFHRISEHATVTHTKIPSSKSDLTTSTNKRSKPVGPVVN